MVAPLIIWYLKTKKCTSTEDSQILKGRLLKLAKDLHPSISDEDEIFNLIDIDILTALWSWWWRDSFPSICAYVFFCLGFYLPIISIIPVVIILLCRWIFTLSHAVKRVTMRILIFYFLGFLPLIIWIMCRPDFHKSFVKYEVDYGISDSMKDAIDGSLIILVFFCIVRIIPFIGFQIVFYSVINSRKGLFKKKELAPASPA